MKRNKGITLITLIITIIILIILAGISISMILGNEGLLNRAKYAKESYSNAQQQEELEIAKYSNDINSYINGNRYGFQKKDLIFSSLEGVSNITTYNLEKNANDYDMLVFCGKYTGYALWGNDTVLKEIYTLNERIRIGIHDTSDIAAEVVINGNEFSIIQQWNYKIYYIFGIKF